MKLTYVFMSCLINKIDINILTNTFQSVLAQLLLQYKNNLHPEHLNHDSDVSLQFSHFCIIVRLVNKYYFLKLLIQINPRC